MNSITWDTLDWTVLDRLREIFLAGQQAPATYWTSLEDLANYNFTYAQRIGWKWDAALSECKDRGFARADQETVVAVPGSSVASMTAQRVSSMGVAWVSTTEPAPSPATMVMTMVRGSGQ